MKKSVVTVCIAAVLSLALLAGCAAQVPAPQEAPASSEAVDEEPEQAEEEPAEEAEISSAEEPENAEDASKMQPRRRLLTRIMTQLPIIFCRKQGRITSPLMLRFRLSIFSKSMMRIRRISRYGAGSG